MKKILLATLLFLVPCVGFTQSEEGDDIIVDDRGVFFQAPDYQLIKDSIGDPNGHYYYPRLLERLAQGDTTLDINDVRCIYYGYTQQPDFDPYMSYDELGNIQKILFGNEEPTKADFEKVIELADRVLAKKPTELPMYYYRLIGCFYGYGEEDPRTAVARFQFSAMMDAVYSSGDGSREAPFHLSTVAHSYFIMSMNDLSPEYQSLGQVDGRYCDIFPIEANEHGVDTLYFDIHECFMSLSRMFESHDEASTTRAGTQLELPLGTHFIIKLEEDLNEEDTQFKVVTMEPFDKVIDRYDNNYLFSEEGEPGTIEGYFCRSTYGTSVEEIRDNVKIVLITKSWCDGMASFDTDIRRENGAWEKTSNNGAWPKVTGTEIWSPVYDMLRISNLRKMSD